MARNASPTGPSLPAPPSGNLDGATPAGEVRITPPRARLGRSAILRADDLPREEIYVPEWGGTVTVRTMTAGERSAYEARADKDPEANPAPLLLAFTACDEAGNLLFTPEDVRELERKNAKLLLRIFRVAVRLNKITAEDLRGLEEKS